MVILYGHTSNMIDFEQMAGRGGRDGHTKCLVLFIAESWLFTEHERNTNNLSSKASRTSDEVYGFTQTSECRRIFLANMNEDATDQGKIRWLLIYAYMLTILKLLTSRARSVVILKHTQALRRFQSDAGYLTLDALIHLLKLKKNQILSKHLGQLTDLCVNGALLRTKSKHGGRAYTKGIV